MPNACAILATLFTLSVPVSAQAPDRWVAARLGLLLERGDSRGANQPAVLGATAGMWFSPYWGADVTAQAARVDFSTVHASGTESLVAGSLLMNLNPGGTTWNPYLKLGIGAGTYRFPDHSDDSLKSRSKAMALAGLGLQYRPGGRWFFGMEFLGVQAEWHLHEWPLTASVGMTF